MKLFLDLTKPGIALFSIVAALIGFAVSFPIGESLDVTSLILFVAGVYLVSSGAFALNQAQEYKIDQKMERTKNRPIASGRLLPIQGALIGLILIVWGSLFLFLVQPLSAAIGLLIVVLYNGFYTLWWKRSSPYGVIPGAIPGALPVTLGFSVNSSDLFSPQSMYLFMVLFLWQMPHFWCLSIRYKEDYKSGGIPVMPVVMGVPKTMYFVGLYTFAYVAMALVAPWFVESKVMFLALVLPMSIILLREFYRYFKSIDAIVADKYAWLRFFLFTNLSVIVYAAAPAIERWMQFIYYVHVGV
jgi:protoheme IX farnesyltransferase